MIWRFLKDLCELKTGASIMVYAAGQQKVDPVDYAEWTSREYSDGPCTGTRLIYRPIWCGIIAFVQEML